MKIYLSVRGIADNHAELWRMQGSKPLFYGVELLNFAKDNKVKYELNKRGDDFLVNLDNRDRLVKDFLDSIGKTTRVSIREK